MRQTCTLVLELVLVLVLAPVLVLILLGLTHNSAIAVALEHLSKGLFLSCKSCCSITTA